MQIHFFNTFKQEPKIKVTGPKRRKCWMLNFYFMIAFFYFSTSSRLQNFCGEALFSPAPPSGYFLKRKKIFFFFLIPRRHFSKDNFCFLFSQVFVLSHRITMRVLKIDIQIYEQLAICDYTTMFISVWPVTNIRNMPQPRVPHYISWLASPDFNADERHTHVYYHQSGHLG